MGGLKLRVECCHCHNTLRFAVVKTSTVLRAISDEDGEEHVAAALSSMSNPDVSNQCGMLLRVECCYCGRTLKVELKTSIFLQQVMPDEDEEWEEDQQQQLLQLQQQDLGRQQNQQQQHSKQQQGPQ